MIKHFVVLICAMLLSSQKSEWASLLEQLNEGLDASPQNRASEDLLKKYKEELAAIGSEWSKKNHEKTSKDYSEKKNTFYMAAIDQKSKDDFLTLEKSAELSSFDIDDAAIQSILTDATAYQFFNHGDPKTIAAEIAIGFCFYKALMAHYFLLQRGVPQKNIKKIFAVGPLIYHSLVWKFHVAVAVQAKGKVWVIDPLVKKVATLEEWKKELHTYSAENPYPRLRFYVTEPQKFLPHSKEYTLELIDHAKTKKYNPAFLAYLKKKGQPKN
jgi:hypothetical protein